MFQKLNQPNIQIFQYKLNAIKIRVKKQPLFTKIPHQITHKQQYKNNRKRNE